MAERYARPVVQGKGVVRRDLRCITRIGDHGGRAGACLFRRLEHQNDAPPLGTLPAEAAAECCEGRHMAVMAAQMRLALYLRNMGRRTKLLDRQSVELSTEEDRRAGLGARVDDGQPVTADVTVTNSGSRAGDEVVQAYIKFPNVKGAPKIALRGFHRIHLEPGASQTVHFDLKDRDLVMVTEDGNPIIAGGDYSISIGGGQPATGAPSVTGKFHVDGQIALPE